MFSVHNRALSSKKCGENLFQYEAGVLSLKTYFILTLLESKRSAIFEATTYFAISLP